MAGGGGNEGGKKGGAGEREEGRGGMSLQAPGTVNR